MTMSGFHIPDAVFWLAFAYLGERTAGEVLFLVLFVLLLDLRPAAVRRESHACGCHVGLMRMFGMAMVRAGDDVCTMRIMETARCATFTF